MGIGQKEGFLGAILSALKALKASIDKHKKAKPIQRETHGTPDETHQQRYFETIVRLPPEITEYYGAERRQQEQKRSWERWKRIVEASAVLIALAVAVLNLCTLRQVIRQADNSETRIRIMQKQLIASERPWLSARISMSQPLKFTEKGGSIGITGVIKNVGHSPALNVRFNAKVIADTGGASGLHQRQVEYGDIWKNRSAYGGLPGSVIFPGEEHIEGQVTGISVDEIQKGLATALIEGKISTILIVCIDYLFSSVDLESARPEDHHQTWYAYPLGVPYEWGGWMGYFEPSGTPSGVVLIGSMMGEFAN